ncbi:ribulokinase [Pedosphaera parvula]|uniref:Carbohydrate kinase FGGY n=1 Tax=Pedosphaera parvula (strain Ellin514) TaxID=320771 RepID=B9XJ82_PEDPL|nr:ribulokinase [Pedosphaera parvula]EEF60120.1 carbohydrate kinase FGGY [Pedosphaera parvula Ellin514]
MKDLISLGLDFGTESVRALLVDLKGHERGSSVVGYRHGQITQKLPGSKKNLLPDFALQHPRDWIDSAARAIRQALLSAKCVPSEIIGIGVDFTSCTMLPTKSDGTPLCLLKQFAAEPMAWPKLWKHHGARTQADAINALAHERKEPWLAHYGGTIGLEWFFPKVLETLEVAPKVYAAADVWLEAGDWFVWQLVGGSAKELARSTCQAGYKAMWNRQHGYPASEFFRAMHPKMATIVQDKLPGRFLAPGELAGGLSASMATKFGLRPGTPVSAAIIDAHAGVPGAGASEPGTLVMVMGTSSCHMLNSDRFQAVPGVAGIVEEGILPGMVGYETGQAAVGDAFDWLRRTLGQSDFSALTRMAAKIPAGSEGVICMDWFNGCRTPLMDGTLSGAFAGLTLRHTPAHLYRALLEASAFGVRWIVELLREHGVSVNRFVATGGLPHHNPLLVQIYADVLGESISVPPSKQGPALGAAILGALAAGKAVTGFSDVEEAIRTMAAPPRIRRATSTIKPRPGQVKSYSNIYPRYRQLANMLQQLSQG